MTTRADTAQMEVSAETTARCQLLVIEGPDAGRGVPVDDATVVVGTGKDCDLILSDDRVSARHAEVRRDRGRFIVRDLGSRNGTLFEGSRLTEARLATGATLKMGRSFLRLEPQRERVDLAPSQSRRLGEIVAESLAMREVFAVLELAARSDATLLVQGETGTGKELVARAVHDGSKRRASAFVAVDCSAMPEGLVESELFGHVKGAFTGASGNRLGAFGRADHGTLFLDELDSVTASVQARLLRVIEERHVRPVGSDEERAVDVRVVAASRRDLSTRVAEGEFRADLYYRLSVVSVTLPPLRRRREDIPVIVKEILRRRGIEAGPVTGPGADVLNGYDWPGNVRELRNAVDRALALSPEARTFTDLRFAVGSAGTEDGLTIRADLPFKEARKTLNATFERRYLRDLMARHRDNISAAARASGIDRKHLKTLLRRHGLAKPE